VEEEQKRLEELMRLYGLEEKEARAAYHLGLAEELFEEISEEAYRRGGFPTVRGVQAWMHDEMDFGEHFHALRNQLARRVLRYEVGLRSRALSARRPGISEVRRIYLLVTSVNRARIRIRAWRVRPRPPS
jgi:hypothetical protein